MRRDTQMQKKYTNKLNYRITIMAIKSSLNTLISTQMARAAAAVEHFRIVCRDGAPTLNALGIPPHMEINDLKERTFTHHGDLVIDASKDEGQFNNLSDVNGNLFIHTSAGRATVLALTKLVQVTGAIYVGPDVTLTVKGLAQVGRLVVEGRLDAYAPLAVLGDIVCHGYAASLRNVVHADNVYMTVPIAPTKDSYVMLPTRISGTCCVQLDVEGSVNEPIHVKICESRYINEFVLTVPHRKVITTFQQLQTLNTFVSMSPDGSEVQTVQAPNLTYLGRVVVEKSCRIVLGAFAHLAALPLKSQFMRGGFNDTLQIGTMWARFGDLFFYPDDRMTATERLKVAELCGVTASEVAKWIDTSSQLTAERGE